MFLVTQIYRMPILNRFENYHECMGVYGADALYCVADAFVKPDLNSNLFTLISQYNKDTKKHFRRDNLLRGLCLNSCKERIEMLGNDSNKYFTQKFPIRSKVMLKNYSYFAAISMYFLTDHLRIS